MSRSARRWRPPWLVQVSLGLHVGGAAALAAWPEHWPWVVGTMVADHAAVFSAGLLPRSGLLGANVTRLPPQAARRGEAALTFDDGPDPDATPAVLDLLQAAGVRATFFCIGSRAERHPELVAEIARRGHRVENHSFRHAYGFAFYGPRRLQREIERAQRSLERASGRRPALFRPPAGIRGPFLDLALHRCGLRLVSWSRRGYDSVSGDARRVTRRLTRGLRPGEILLLHDGSPAVGAGGRPVVLEALPRILDECRRLDLRLVPIPDDI